MPQKLTVSLLQEYKTIMRILFVAPFYKPAHVYGGPTYSIPTICEALVNAGESVTVYTTNANGIEDLPYTPGILQDVQGVQVLYLKRNFHGNFFFSQQLASTCIQKINTSNFDVVYIASNWGFPFIPACWSSFLKKVPYIISPRASFKRNAWEGKYFKKFSYHLLFERFLINRASLIHYTTILESNQSRWLNLKPPQVIIPNPVDFQKFDSLPSKSHFRNKFKIEEDKKVILILGRIDPDKGLDLALQSLQLVVKQVSNVLLVIAGPEENNYIQKLQSLAKILNIEEHLLFTGLLDAHQRVEALVDADILFSPSRSENFGMSIVEAMACELPVIITDQVGVADFVEREDAGLVVPLDHEQMANGLIKLLNDPFLCRDFSKRAAIAVRNNFAPEKVAAQFLECLSKIQRV